MLSMSPLSLQNQIRDIPMGRNRDSTLVAKPIRDGGREEMVPPHQVLIERRFFCVGRFFICLPDPRARSIEERNESASRQGCYLYSAPWECHVFGFEVTEETCSAS